MFTPKPFVEDDPDILFGVIEQNNFGLLITGGGEGLTATHLPFTVDRDAGGWGRLQCHMAKANPVWRSFADRREVLAVFSGPHAYVSPSWYESQPMVPTWNYVAVHVYGTPELLATEDDTVALLTRLADGHEAALASDWRTGDLPADYLNGMLKGMVGFNIPISRIEGKAKMSQNRGESDRAGVITGLRNLGDAGSLVVADLMERQGG